MANIQAIYRYPIKGLSPEPLNHATLAPGQTVPGDRLYAIENGPSGFDPAAPAHLPKQHFLMLMRNERLAALRTVFDHASHTLVVALPAPWNGADQPVEEACPTGATVKAGSSARGDLRTPAGREAIERYFAAFCADELRGPPKVLRAPGHSFSDNPAKVVSFINLASLDALADLVGAKVQHLRFRANIYVAGWPAWSELDLVDREFAIGATRLKVVKRIKRCAATNVDPDTGIRDLNLPQTIMRTFGHPDCGVYAEVTEGGDISQGDSIEIH